MSKFKDKLLRDQDEHYSYMVSYQEWLDRNLKPLTSDEINKLEKDFWEKPSLEPSKLSLSKLALNNTNYNNKPLGA